MKEIYLPKTEYKGVQAGKHVVVIPEWPVGYRGLAGLQSRYVGKTRRHAERQAKAHIFKEYKKQINSVIGILSRIEAMQAKRL